jgi:N-methylhydantoinase A
VQYRVAIDIGGTFTDLVVENPSGELATTKVLSTPPNLVDGVIDALDRSGVALADLGVFVHGTTQGLNALLERRGAKVALVTTEGFRDTYLLGRGHRPDMYNLHYKKPTPLLDRAATFEVTERLDAEGGVLTAVDTASVSAVARSIAAGGYEAVAVCLLHSYLNPEHEKTVVAQLEAELPGVSVVASYQVAPEWREYERTSTTVMSAYITPIMRNYLAELESALSDAGLRVPVYINESNGGVMVAHLAADHAVGTLLSGPVGGVIGTAALSGLVDGADLISADVGGTSFDVSIVRDGKPALRTEFEMQELPVLAPSVEVHTIGAGGGSLITVDPSGRLRVGPESAGAIPGPACYGRGATIPSVTDAHAVLGRIPAAQRLGGSLELDLGAAEAIMAEVGGRLSLGVVELAEQALQIVNFRMAEAIRELTTERGLDPRGFVLCFFGGAGGLHATDVANELEISRILIPALPGSFSAAGMLRGGIQHDLVQSFFRSQSAAESDLPVALAALRERAEALLIEESVDLDAAFFDYFADVRYVGQEYSMRVPLENEGGLGNLIETFHEAYQERYSHSNRGAEIELVALRVTAGKSFDEKIASFAATSVQGEPIGSQPVFFQGEQIETPVWNRDDVVFIEGPALILETTSTTVVPPFWTVTAQGDGHLFMERKDA